VQLLTRLVRAVGTDGTDTRIDIQSFLDQLERLKKEDAQAATEDLSGLLDVPPGLNEILSEYEEHRFRDNLKRKIPFFRISLRPSPGLLRHRLKLLTDGIKEVGELLTTLPSRTGGGGDDRFLLYFTSRRELPEIAAKVGGGGGNWRRWRGGRKEAGPFPPPPWLPPPLSRSAEAAEAPEGKSGGKMTVTSSRTCAGSPTRCGWTSASSTTS